MRVDAVDIQIIELLSGNGRLTCAQIARQIGPISERSVRYRLDKLISAGVIQVNALINPHIVGYPVTADVLIEADPSAVVDIAHLIASLQLVTYVACLASGSEISVQVVARDNNELFQFVSEALGKLEGVKGLATSIIPQVIKEPQQWRIPSDSLSDTI